MFLFNAHQRCNYYDVHMLDIVHDCVISVQVILTTIHDAILNQLRGVQLDELVIATIDSVLSRDGPYGKLFSGLETNYLQLKYFRNHFNFVVRFVSLEHTHCK